MEKIGVFICKSCDIGNRLDITELEATAREEGISSVYSAEFLCSKEGKAFIDSKIQEDGLDAVSICACSFRVNYDVFNFGRVAVDRVNLREGVVWSRFPVGENGEILDDSVEVASGVSFKDELMALAKDYIRMSIAKLRVYKLPESFKPEEELSKTILVIGGGVAGLTAALECARLGYPVVLVEKEKELGGFAAKLKAQCQANYPYTELVNPIVFDLIKEVESNDLIKVYGSTIRRSCKITLSCLKLKLYIGHYIWHNSITQMGKSRCIEWFKTGCQYYSTNLNFFFFSTLLNLSCIKPWSPR